MKNLMLEHIENCLWMLLIVFSYKTIFPIFKNKFSLKNEQNSLPWEFLEELMNAWKIELCY